MGGGAWPLPCPIIGTPPLRSPAIEIESRQLIKLAPISDTNLASTSRGASGAPPPPLTRVWERRALSPYFIFLEKKKAPTNRPEHNGLLRFPIQCQIPAIPLVQNCICLTFRVILQKSLTIA